MFLSIIKSVFLVLFFSAIVSLHAGMEIDYYLKSEFLYDSNLPRNITEYSGFHVRPCLFTKIGSDKGFPLSVWTYINIDNYDQRTNPVLNHPLIKAGTSGDWDWNNSFELDVDLSYSSYHYATWQVAKNSVEADIDMEKTFKRISIMADIGIGFDNYPGNDDDALQLNELLGVLYDFRVLKSDNIAIREIELSVYSRQNMEEPDTGNYAKYRGKLKTEIKLWFMDLKLFTSLAYKRYSDKLTHPHTGIAMYPENRYLGFGYQLEIPLIKKLEFELESDFGFKDSNHPLYDYDRHTHSLSIKWSSDFTLEKEEE